MHIVEPTTGQALVAATNLTAVLWSKVQFVSHDDMIALEAAPSVAGAKLVVDIELARVQPGDRLSGRYAGGL